jgi:pimeloyl-ACP methyl ester carboxylesterase
MPSYVLIPGAGGDAREWNRLVTELESRGHEAIAISLPAGDDDAGWKEYADAVVRAVGDRPGLVLVAQSLAGFTAPLVCEHAPVDLLILLNAMIPQPGETGEAWWSNTGWKAAAAEYRASIGLSDKDAEDDNVVYFHDVPKEVVADYVSGPEFAQSWTPMTQPWPLAAWPDVPTRVLAGRDDRLFPATFQQRIARERLGIDADVIDGGHMVALSRPRELAERLEAYRRELDG